MKGKILISLICDLLLEDALNQEKKHFIDQESLLNNFFKRNQIKSGDQQILIQSIYQGFHKNQQIFYETIHSLTQSELFYKSLGKKDKTLISLFTYLFFIRQNCLDSDFWQIQDFFPKDCNDDGISLIAAQALESILLSSLDIITNDRLENEELKITEEGVEEEVTDYKNSWLLESWLKAIDQNYFREEILPGIIKQEEKYEKMLHSIRQYMKPIKEKTSKKTTEPQPFQLTQTIKKVIEVPKFQPKVIKAQPVPKSHYDQKSKTLRLLEKRKEKLHHEFKDQLLSAQEKPFAVWEQTDKWVQQKRNMPKETEIPIGLSSPLKPKVQRKLKIKETKPVDIKKTVASVLREEAFYRKKMEEEQERLEKELESSIAGVISHKELEIRELELKEKEEQLERLNKARLQLQVQLSREEALQAKQKAKEQNKQIALELKLEKEKLEAEKEERLIESLEKQRELVDAVQSTRENVAVSKAKLLIEKRAQVEEDEQKWLEMKKQKELEYEEEYKRRQELIREIKEIEKNALENIKEYRSSKLLDLSETSGLGVLSEMSILDLQDRLNELKIQEAETEKIKREKIQNERSKKREEIEEKVKMVEKYRHDLQQIQNLDRLSKSECGKSGISKVSSKSRYSIQLQSDLIQQQKDLYHLQKKLLLKKQMRNIEKIIE